MTFSGSEKRHKPRTQCSGTIQLRRLHSLWHFKGALQNIGMLGACIETNQHVTVGEIVCVQFYVKELHQPFECEAKVAWNSLGYSSDAASSRKYSVGLSFHGLTRQQKEQIHALVIHYNQGSAATPPVEGIT